MKTLFKESFISGSCLSEDRIAELGNEYPDYDYAVIKYGNNVGRADLMTREEAVNLAKEWTYQYHAENLEDVTLEKVEHGIFYPALDGEKCFDKFRMSTGYIVQNLR